MPRVDRESRNAWSREWTKRDYALHPEKYAARRLRYRYGITQAEWDDMFYAQEGKCAIKACTNTPTVVDHDARTGKVRQLLCQGCNKSLGLVHESPSVLRGLADYLERHA